MLSEALEKCLKFLLGFFGWFVISTVAFLMLGDSPAVRLAWLVFLLVNLIVLVMFAFGSQTLWVAFGIVGALAANFLFSFVFWGFWQSVFFYPVVAPGIVFPPPFAWASTWALPTDVRGFHSAFEGRADHPQCWAIGWAFDPDTPDSDLTVRVLADGEVVSQTVANIYWDSLTEACPGGACAYGADLWNLISYNTEHTILVQAWDVQTSQWISLPGSPKQLLCIAAPNGFHDGNEGRVDRSACQVFGWAAYPGEGSTSLRVKVVVDGADVAQTTANIYRPDLKATGACPGGMCAFLVDLWGLVSHNAAHSIAVQAQDPETGGWKDLQATPKTLTCVE